MVLKYDVPMKCEILQIICSHLLQENIALGIVSCFLLLIRLNFKFQENQLRLECFSPETIRGMIKVGVHMQCAMTHSLVTTID